MTTVKPYEEKEEDFIYLKIRRQDGYTFFECLYKLNQIFIKENLDEAKGIYDTPYGKH